MGKLRVLATLAVIAAAVMMETLLGRFGSADAFRGARP